MQNAAKRVKIRGQNFEFLTVNHASYRKEKILGEYEKEYAYRFAEYDQSEQSDLEV